MHNTSDHVYAVVIQLAAVLVLEPPLAPLHSNSCKFNLAPAMISICQLSKNSTMLTVNDSESGLPQLQQGLLAGSYNAFEPSPKPSCQMENASILLSRSGWVMLVGCSGLTTGQECAPKTGTVITISEVASEDWGAHLGPAGPLHWRWSCAVADPPPRRCFPRGNIGAVEIISLVITISSRRGGEGAMEHIQ